VIQETTTSVLTPERTETRNTAGMSSAELAALWAEVRLAYPLYAALATELNLAPPPHLAGELPPVRPTRAVFDCDLSWLDKIDENLLAYQLRQVRPEILNASEESLRAFIQRQLRKPDKTTADRDKVDWLLVQYFALCAPEDLYRQTISLDDVARVLQPVLVAADSTALEWCEPLDKILESLEHCQSLRDIMENGLLEQGRLLKDTAGCMFYDPAALVAFCRFNFLLRRAFIRLLHTDLSAMREHIQELESKGVRTVDCRRAGLSAAETTSQLRHFFSHWRQPFQKDYTESAVTRSFEQLLALRADLEEALSKFRPVSQSDVSESSPRDLAPAQHTPEATSPSTSASESAAPAAETEYGVPSKPAPSPFVLRVQQKRSDSPVTPTGAAEADKCLEAIWEQLIAAPPSRGRSMTTVTLLDTKVLLSSWEVSAFVSEGSQESEDLRRAVVARALLAVAMDQRKHSGEENALASALELAKAELSYFQGRVEHAKRIKNTEAAVNLGISTKRLLSFVEEAETLQP
jgi:hypothetical protein